MNRRTDILKQLLFEIDGICKANALRYAVVGKVGTSLLETGDFPEDFTNITVIMTGGDIERFEKIVNQGDRTHREVESFLNNPYARDLQVRYCNSETTSIFYKDIDRHINYGFFIRIRPIGQYVESAFKRKLLRTMKAGYRGSMKPFSSCNAKRIVPVFLLKMLRCIVGRKNSAKILYNYNKKCTFIDKWKDIKKTDINRYQTQDNGKLDIRICHVDGVAIDVLYNSQALEHEYDASHDAAVLMNYSVNTIENTQIPFSRVIGSAEFNSILQTRIEREKYLKEVTKSNRASKYIKHAWNTYLMTRDVVEQRDYYDHEKLSYIEKCISNNDMESYEKEMEFYIASKNKWLHHGVKFIQNEAVEILIKKAPLLKNEGK